MLQNFSYCETISSTSMNSIVKGMFQLFNKMSRGRVPNESFSSGMLHEYINSLIMTQRNDLTTLRKGSWSVAPDVELPTDLRVDVVYFPTYVAVSTLCFYKMHFNEKARSLASFDDCLKSGMRFSCGRSLNGQGIESNMHKIEVLKLLSMGGVLEFLSKDPGYSLKLSLLLRNIRRELSEELKKGTVLHPMGADVTKDYKNALALFKREYSYYWE